ncbi:bacterial PH domain protein (plasmid) [Burkholderia gladioli]|uniref:Bacterial PH domain protein n=1 Tax=Burkholderia gladioli TaxID=28095 RepID=A0AAW3FAJ4_BURGA|nr:PH domain-containing protein [Burkholderia gladioli]AJW93620.1 bacterial PH domain protein [Burkholderia gladioli]KGC24024.1 bacterial PH domain protein [Burkholderia gladioli]
MDNVKNQGREVFNQYNGAHAPAYVRADASRQLRFVPSTLACIPAMFQTWLLLLVLAAGYVHLHSDHLSPIGSLVSQPGHVHKLKPQRVNTFPNVPIWCFFAAAGGLALGRFGWVLLAVKSRSITIEPARLTFSRGVLNRDVHSLEITRIKNVSSHQRWWQRPFGIGTVAIETTDWSRRIFLMEGMQYPHDLRERIIRAGVASRQCYGTTETWVSTL